MIRSIVTRFAVFAGLWWIVTAGAAGSWLIGVPAVGAATFLSWRLRDARCLSVSIQGLTAFAGFFLLESVRGGLDVARRALARPVDVQPGYIIHRTELPPGLPRLFLSGSISLLPGTLTADMRGDELVVHSLATDPDPLAGIAACEHRIRQALLPSASSDEESGRHA